MGYVAHMGTHMGITASTPASNSQKEIERQHLHSFRHLCRDFPIGEVIEGETADFVVITPTGRKIGCSRNVQMSVPSQLEMSVSAAVWRAVGGDVGGGVEHERWGAAAS